MRLIALLTPGGISGCDMWVTLNFKYQSWGQSWGKDSRNGFAVSAVDARGRSCFSCSKVRRTQTIIFLFQWPTGFLTQIINSGLFLATTGPQSAGRNQRVECAISSFCGGIESFFGIGTLRRNRTHSKCPVFQRLFWLGFIKCLLSFHMSFCLLVSPIQGKKNSPPPNKKIHEEKSTCDFSIS